MSSRCKKKLQFTNKKVSFKNHSGLEPISSKIISPASLISSKSLLSWPHLRAIIHLFSQHPRSNVHIIVILIEFNLSIVKRYHRDHPPIHVWTWDLLLICEMSSHMTLTYYRSHALVLLLTYIYVILLRKVYSNFIRIFMTKAKLAPNSKEKKYPYTRQQQESCLTLHNSCCILWETQTHIQ